MHLKRNKMPVTWPVKRKGTKYLIVPSHNLVRGIPVLVVLRDILKLVKNRAEAKKIINLKKVKVNGKIIRDDGFPLTLFDAVNLEGKNFRIILKNKKLVAEELASELKEKIIKVINKKITNGNKLQVNLIDGRNYFTKEKVKVGDSAVIDLKDNKISKILEFKPGCRVLFIAGKHLGDEGVVDNIEGKKIISVKVGKEKLNSEMKSLMVIK